MESIINATLMTYLESNNLLSDRQYGFRRQKSTGDMLALLSEKWNNSIHLLGESKIVALDISKAFDRVWHKALLAKLEAFGVGSCFVGWISNFLAHRSIRVVLDGSFSERYTIDAGVPQGSVLSPTLFLIFINDLLSLTENPIYSFADDSTLCHSYTFSRRPTSQEVSLQRELMNRRLNEDLDKILEWGQSNRVAFNAQKTQCCYLTHKNMVPSPPLTLSDIAVAETETLSMLGLTIQQDLRWTGHVFEVAKSAAKCLGFLKRCRKYFSPVDIRNIYVTHIRPKMEYNSHIWAGAPCHVLSLLDRVQSRAKKLIGDKAIADSLDSLEHRRNVGCITLFYRYFYGRCSGEIYEALPNMKIFGRSSRFSSRAHPFYINVMTDRTAHYRSNSFFARSVRMWNGLPANVFPPSYDIEKFKKNCNLFFKSLPSSSFSSTDS